MNYQASNPESLSKTPERLSETKTRSGSAAKKKRAVEVLTSRTNLTARPCMTVAREADPFPFIARVGYAREIRLG